MPEINGRRDYSSQYLTTVEVNPDTGESRTYEVPNTESDPSRGMVDYDRDGLRNPQCTEYQRIQYAHNWEKRNR